jgi:hypothetical protein
MESKEARWPLLLALAVPSMALAVGGCGGAGDGGQRGGAGGGGKRRAQERRETRLGRYFAI